MTNRKRTLNIRGRLMDLSTPRVMGILNVTPDSFYAGSRTPGAEAVAARVRQIRDEGADFIDIGAYSSRPGQPTCPQPKRWSACAWGWA